MERGDCHEKFSVAPLRPVLVDMVLLGSLVVLVLTAILVSICAKIIYYRFLHPLAGVPGPFVASFSRLPLLSYALGGAEHEIHLALHRRYGPIVRVGPNHILLNDPAHGPWYYSLDKSTWWYSLRPDDHNLAFSTELNIKTHNAKKKRVTAAYSMSSLVANEDAMDRRISVRGFLFGCCFFLMHAQVGGSPLSKWASIPIWKTIEAFLQLSLHDSSTSMVFLNFITRSFDIHNQDLPLHWMIFRAINRMVDSS